MRKEDENLLNTARNVYKELNHSLKTGPWQSNLLLRSIGGKLQSLRDQFAAALRVQESDLNADHALQAQQEQQKQSVFVLLYQARGSDLHRWQNIINNLSEFCINRPIYQKEVDVKANIPTGAASHNHAYVVINVDAEDILPFSEEDPPLDRAGRPLLRLKEDAIKFDNLVRFVHASGEYKWVNRFLVKQGDGVLASPAESQQIQESS